jgi:hypothetical protein
MIKMKEAQFFGTLLPSSPDFLPIEAAIRDKYGLPEVNPEEDPIKKYSLMENLYPSKNSETI